MGQLTQAIAEAVRASGQTTYAIAKGVGVARSQLSRLLSGKRGLSTDTIERLADYLGLRITIKPKGKHGRSGGAWRIEQSVHSGT